MTKRTYANTLAPLLAVPWAVFLAGCTGRQSALAPAGEGAEKIATLFWGMTIGAFAIWLAVLAVAAWATRAHDGPSRSEEKLTKYLVIGGGAVFPTVVLTGLLIYGLSIMPPLLARAPEGSLRIAVTGEQWWWRIQYQPAEGAPFTTANEIRLPVGEPVEFTLESADVIHSFWIPALGGKMDMIPGRQNHLLLTPTRTGTFRGVCAEYCGASHALMAFEVVVMEKADFDRWLESERGEARPPSSPEALRGLELFTASGCAACHTVRGTAADGAVGPDLTHVGSRLSVGAGTLPTDLDALHRWLAQTDTLKPEVQMPHYRMLPEEEQRAIAAYLLSLQ